LEPFRPPRWRHPRQAAQGGPFRQVEGSEASRHSARWWDQYWGEKEAKYASDPRIAAGVDQQLKNRTKLRSSVRLSNAGKPSHTRRSSSLRPQPNRRLSRPRSWIRFSVRRSPPARQPGVYRQQRCSKSRVPEGSGSFASAGDNAALGMTDQARKAVQQQYNDIAKRSDATSNQFNNFSGDMWGDLQGSYNDLNASDQGAVSKYNKRRSPHGTRNRGRLWRQCGV